MAETWPEAAQLRAKLDQLVKRDNEDTDYTLTNTVDFYASHHPDIFGADITEADTSAVNTPRSTLMGGKLADDSISNAQHHTARSNATRSVRMLAPREMPVHAGSHARRLRERGYSEQNGGVMVVPGDASVSFFNCRLANATASGGGGSLFIVGGVVALESRIR